jgi:hypothetical protein
MYPRHFPDFLKKTLYGFIALVVRLKWAKDRRSLPLRPHDWELYLDIHIASALRLHRLPNLIAPVGYNDEVKWLMLFSQHELMPVCADKFRVRQYVAQTIGEEFLIPVKAVGESWTDIEQALKEGDGVVKCSHDSGTATLFDSLGEEQIHNLKSLYESRLLREHGVGKGEWHYRGIKPLLIVEEKLPGSRPEVGPADIKVHCVDGEPRMVHIIDSRQTASRQAFFSPEGEALNLRIKPHRAKIENFDFEGVRKKIFPLVSRLAKPFSYVRVDFYLVGEKPYFGELTFFEEAGLFLERSEELDLASAIGIRCDNPQPTIHRSLFRTDST